MLLEHVTDYKHLVGLLPRVNVLLERCIGRVKYLALFEHMLSHLCDGFILLLELASHYILFLELLVDCEDLLLKKEHIFF